MKKLIVHSGIALVMVILGAILMGLIASDTISAAVTTVRLYSLNNALPLGQGWVSLDVTSTTQTTTAAPTLAMLWGAQWPGPDSTCAQMTNLTAEAGGACLATRRTMQASILAITNCALNRSQACQFINQLVSGLAYQTNNIVTINGVNISYPYMAGRKLGGTGTVGSAVDLMQRAIRNAPLLLHNAYQSTLRENFAFSAPSMYLLVVLFVALNVWSELLVALGVDDWKMGMVRPLTLLNLLPVVGIFVAYFVVYQGATGLLLIIFLPTTLVIVWYFEMLPALQKRPFVRPSTFCVVYAVLTLLAMTYNGVRRYDFIVVELLKAMGLGLTYMGVCWYFLGLWEKMQSKETLAPLYSTREAHVSVLLCVFVMAAVPFFTWLAPYNYTFASPILLSHPVTFLLLSFGTLLALNTEATHQDRASRTRHKDLVSFLCAVLLLFTLVVCGKGAVEFINVYLADTRTAVLPVGPNYIQYAFNQATQLGPYGGLISTR
jgi:hypothetical protein